MDIVLNKLVHNIVPDGKGETVFDGDVILHGFYRSFQYFDKFKVLKDNILFNYFLLEDKKEMLLNYFCKVQNAYHSLLKFKYICKMKIAKESNHIFDLFLDNLSNHKTNRKITIIENNVKYEFKLTDLMHIITSAITHSDSLFVMPLEPKNPYTNIPFSYHNLCNIFLACFLITSLSLPSVNIINNVILIL